MNSNNVEEFFKEISFTGSGENGWRNDLITHNGFKLHGGLIICENFLGVNISGTDES